jgi:3-hydroxybutyryl-CoA dehydrogenase
MTTAARLLLPNPARAHVAVIGGGIMGADVALVFARAGCRTVIVEPSAERRAMLPAHIDAGLHAIGAARWAGRCRSVAALADLSAEEWARIDLVVECIPEKLPLKQSLFAELATLARPGAILASNSSSFPISAIAAGLPGRERMLGLHFFMPAHLVPLVEVVWSSDTNPSAADALGGFMRRCGSVPVQVRKDNPGFLANRLQHALAREAFAMIDEGVATAEDVDAAVRFGFGFRFLAAGPVLQRDHAGLDTHTAAAATMYPSLATNTVPAQALSSRVAAGTLGMKTGQGFFPWTAESIAAERLRYDTLLRQGLQLLASELPAIDPGEETTP